MRIECPESHVRDVEWAWRPVLEEGRQLVAVAFAPGLGVEPDEEVHHLTRLDWRGVEARARQTPRAPSAVPGGPWGRDPSIGTAAAGRLEPAARYAPAPRAAPVRRRGCLGPSVAQCRPRCRS